VNRGLNVVACAFILLALSAHFQRPSNPDLSRRTARLFWVFSRAGALGLAALVVATNLAVAQDKLAQPRRGDDEPPPLELQPYPPPGTSKQPAGPDPLARLFPDAITCKPADAKCEDPMGFGATHMYSRLRQCWQPPGGSRIETSFLFGEAANQAKPPDAAKGVMSIKFGLKPDGSLVASPRSIGSAPPALVDGAIRAIQRCQPYNMMPLNNYRDWKDVLLRIRIELGRPAGEPKPSIDPESYTDRG
jgi:hypothetical protein